MSEFNGRELSHIGYRAVMAAIIEDILNVRNQLQQFDALQTDFAVRFHIAVLDANLRAAAEGRVAMTRYSAKACALWCTTKLAASISNPRMRLRASTVNVLPAAHKPQPRRDLR